MLTASFFLSLQFMFRLCSKFALWLFGWKIEGSLPVVKKYVIIGAPHSSNWDFVLAILAKFSLQIPANFIGKHTLFRPPFGFVFRWLGGKPVDRSKANNLVKAIVEIFNREESMVLGIAPEGTRSKVEKWKTGFYYIAHLAQVPVVMAVFDYPGKRLIFSPPFYTTGDLEKDMVVIKDYYRSFV